MAGKKIGELVSQILAPYFEENGYELFSTEFVKEGKSWFLRVAIEKKAGDEYVPVSTDDCEAVSRFLSARLDELDPIQQNYYLEVSSPGLDRPLVSDKDFVRFRGELVDVSLYRAMDGKKTITGELVSREDGFLILLDEKKQEWKIPMEQVARTRLAVVF